MAVRLVNYEDRLRQAVKAFWISRSAAVAKQETLGRRDQGNRGAVTGGKNMDGFRDMFIDVVRKYGPEGALIHRDKSLVVVPGFFRPTKSWDILVVHERRLLAALELKSLCGPSFGNNANNRCEEAIGSGYDFRKAQSQGLLGPGATPFLGYFLLIEDDERSRSQVRAQSPHFPTDPAFQKASYQQRMKILCERLMEQQLYSSAALLSAAKGSTGESTHLSVPTSFRALLTKLAGHLAGERASGGPVKDEPRSTEPFGFLEGDFFEPMAE
jgi:hypothetical protein